MHERLQGDGGHHAIGERGTVVGDHVQFLSGPHGRPASATAEKIDAGIARDAEQPVPGAVDPLARRGFERLEARNASPMFVSPFPIPWTIDEEPMAKSRRRH